MKLSRRWLEAFLRRPLESRELVERLAMLGAPVDAVTPLFAELKDVVIGKVEEVRPHPNADRLRLCTVNAGKPQLFNVVCGATNVTAGVKYPFAPVGATLPGGVTLEKRKIRGEYSEGMLCSARELGLGQDHEGILALETDAEPGASFIEVFGLEDERLELDVSPQRPDLLGHKGIARELGAAYGVQFRLPEIPGTRTTSPDPSVGRVYEGPVKSTTPFGAFVEIIPGVEGLLQISELQHGRTEKTEHTAGPPTRRPTGTTGGITVTIQPGAACGRFTGAVIRGVKVGPSPDWLRRRLEAVGQRSISNVVDATNYVMFELGQPLHAYDAAKIPGSTLIVRQAAAGEQLTTLDGLSRRLPEGTTVVADGAGVSGIGGVMGGAASEVSRTTTDVFLEAAWWNPAPLRKARKALGILTEASHRFERGTDLWAVPDALRRCIEVVLATAGGTLHGEPLDLWPEPANPPRIFLRTARVAQIIGAELPVSELERCLVAIGCTALSKPGEGRLAVEVPGWRPDLREEIDLVEEVARIHGYEKLPDELRPFRAGNQTDDPMHLAANAMRRHLVAEGLYEAVLMALGPQEDRTAGPPDRPTAQVPVLNPLSADHGFLRSRLLPGLTRQVEANWATQVRDVRLFEIGTVFRSVGAGARPFEAVRVGLVLTGSRWPAHWSDGGNTPDCDAWDLEGLFQRTVSLAIPGASVQVEGDGWIARMPDGPEVGRAGPLSADAPPWAAPLFGLEVDIDPAPRAGARYVRLPTVPAASRDLSLLLPEGVTVAAAAGLVRETAGALLESLRVIDEYRGKGVPKGRRGVALGLVFRSPERTLRDAEVEALVHRIITALGRALDVTVRTA